MSNTPYITTESGSPSASIASVATTSATNSSPYGYASASQADSIVTTLNSILAALRAAGIIKAS